MGKRGITITKIALKRFVAENGVRLQTERSCALMGPAPTRLPRERPDINANANADGFRFQKDFTTSDTKSNTESMTSQKPRPLFKNIHASNTSIRASTSTQ